MGGGGSSDTSQTQKWEPPEWTVGAYKDLVTGAANLASKPYEAYNGMETSPWNGYQQGAANMIEDRATQGAPDINAARAAATNAAQGEYANPWAGNIQGLSKGEAYNPALAGATALAQGTPNPFGSDAYTQQLIQQTTDNMTGAWQTGGAAQNDAMANNAGGWGGGGWRAMQESGNAALNKQIGQMTSQTLQDQQRYKGGLYDQDRTAQERALNMQSQMYNQDVANQINATTQGGNMWNQDISNILQGGQLGLQTSQEDWTSADKMMKVGNDQNAYMQKLLDSAKAQWTAAQQHPYQALDVLGTALGKASGVGGSSFSQTTGPGQNPLMGLAGLGLSAASLW